jgi:hypothetical protein
MNDSLAMIEPFQLADAPIPLPRLYDPRLRAMREIDRRHPWNAEDVNQLRSLIEEFRDSEEIPEDEEKILVAEHDRLALEAAGDPDMVDRLEEAAQEWKRIHNRILFGEGLPSTPEIRRQIARPAMADRAVNVWRWIGDQIEARHAEVLAGVPAGGGKVALDRRQAKAIEEDKILVRLRRYHAMMDRRITRIRTLVYNAESARVTRQIRES